MGLLNCRWFTANLNLTWLQFIKKHFALRRLNRRSPPPSPTAATTAEIQASPVDKLEALAEALLDFQGPADLAAWLAANS